MVYFKITYVDEQKNTHHEEGLVDGTTAKEGVDVIYHWYDAENIDELYVAPIDSLLYKEDMDFLFEKGDSND